MTHRVKWALAIFYSERMLGQWFMAQLHLHRRAYNVFLLAGCNFHLGWGHFARQNACGKPSLQRIWSLVSFPNRTESKRASWEHILLECFSLWVQLFKSKPFVDFYHFYSSTCFEGLLTTDICSLRGKVLTLVATWVKNGFQESQSVNRACFDVFGCKFLVWCDSDEFSSNDIWSK